MPADLTEYSSNQLTVVAERPLRDASEASGTNMAIEPEDVLRVLVALSYEFDQPDWQARVVMLLDVFIDGLLQLATPRDPIRQPA